MKPTSVEIGQRYRYGDNLEYTVIRKEPGGWRLRWNDNGEESGMLYSDEATLTDTFLGWAPGYGPSPGTAVMGERDWARWLPPGPLPNTGNKELKPGQVWAFWTDGAVGPLVVRVEDVGGAKVLAAPKPRHWDYMSFAKGGNHQRHAVLVADVDCEPTPPEILYALGPAVPKPGSGMEAPAPAKGQRWRSRPGSAYKPYNNGSPFTLAERHGNGWRDEIQALHKCTYWQDEAFTDGTLVFVDHGPTMESPRGEGESLGARRTSPPAPAVATTKREVSQDGKTWVDYSRLNDPDAFEAYPHWRELVTMTDGTFTERKKQPAEPRGYSGRTWAEHVAYDENCRFGMDCRIAPGAAKRAPQETLHLPGSAPPQRRAYATRSKS